MRALVLSRETAALVWIDAVGHCWSAPDPEQVVDATLSQAGLVAGRWRFTWIDPQTAAGLAQGGQRVEQDSQISMAVPPFRTDVALRLDRHAR